MAHYTVHVPESEMAMGMDSPLTALEAIRKVEARPRQPRRLTSVSTPSGH
jgi:hypothetical protein